MRAFGSEDRLVRPKVKRQVSGGEVERTADHVPDQARVFCCADGRRCLSSVSTESDIVVSTYAHGVRPNLAHSSRGDDSHGFGALGVFGTPGRSRGVPHESDENGSWCGLHTSLQTSSPTPLLCPVPIRLIPRQGPCRKISTGYGNVLSTTPTEPKLFGPWLRFWPIRRAGLLSRIWTVSRLNSASGFWTT